MTGRKKASAKGNKLLGPIRVPGSRDSIAREFAIPTTIDGLPLPLSFPQIQEDPRLMALAAKVHTEVRMQFASNGADKLVETEQDASYRQKLEGWADALEIMLDEVLKELERVRPMRVPEQQDLV